MDRNLIKFSEEIIKPLGNDLVALIVYGSKAAGDFFKDSDFNTLIVMETIDTKLLAAISKPVEKWVKKGQPIPLIFTRKSILSSQDVFPIEFLDIIDNHILLSGTDIFSGMIIDRKNLRLEIEREFKSKLIRLNQAYIMAGRDRNKAKKLLSRSVSTIIALIKASIRLYGKNAPSKKIDIIKAAPADFNLNKQLFERILKLKEGVLDIPGNEIEDVFNSYLFEVDKFANIIDQKD
jgi:predicted nucleotidyltransferase